MVVQIAVGVSHFISRKARKTSDISLESSTIFLWESSFSAVFDHFL
eukprot:UN20639